MLTVVLLLCNVWTVRVQAEFMKGVNYGNRFAPEAWMNMREWQHDYRDSIFGPYYGSNVSAPDGVDRVSLCDVTDNRILKWLNDTIQEDDFIKMKEYGVRLLRLPTGYWNWVDLGDKTPEVPEDVAPRYRNLQAVKPSQYEPYIDLIFHYAKQYGIQLFPELHGAPGSQNGAEHTGCVFGYKEDGKKNHGYFAPPKPAKNEPKSPKDRNMQIALDVMDKMADKCVQHPGVCWGIGPINEPQGDSRWNTDYMQTYFEEAILTIRQKLPQEFPVVLFAWPGDFGWPTWSKWFKLPYDKYGTVMFDTHIYTWPHVSPDVAEVLRYNEPDLEKIRAFQEETGYPVIVGEFTLANLQKEKGGKNLETADWQLYADSIFPLIETYAEGGALLWNWDCQFAGWSMKGLAEETGITWNL